MIIWKNLLTISTIYRSNQDIQSHLEREVATRTAKLDMLIENGMLMSMTRERTALAGESLLGRPASGYTVAR